MRTTLPVPRLAAKLAAVVLTASACADREPTALPGAAPAPVPRTAATLRCTVAVRAGTLVCERTGAPSGARGAILGGQGTNVRLASSGTSYDGGTQILRSDVTVQNLTAQPLGTTTGYSPAPEGVRVVFASAPSITGGSGKVTVANADGVDVFTAAGQAYFQYDGILFPGDTTPAREWRFSVPPTVEAFVFTVFVAAPVPREAGSVKLVPLAPSLAVGDTQRMSATVRGVTGRVLAGLPVTWTTSDSAVATVDSTGRITAVGAGSAMVTAASGARTGRVTVEVVAAPGPPPATIVSVGVEPARVSATGADTVWAVGGAASATALIDFLFVLNGPGGNQLQCHGSLASGTLQDGVFRCPFVIPAGARAGVWALSTVLASNGHGTRQLFLSAILDAGGEALVRVRSPDEDVTAPTLAGFTFAPDTAVAGADSVTVEIGVADAGVGAAQAEAIFRNPNDAPGVVHGCGTNGLASGTPIAGTFRCVFAVRPDALPGTFTAIYVQLLDMNGNMRTIPTAELDSAGYPTQLVVLAPDGP